jgi:hypothetical protein
MLAKWRKFGFRVTSANQTISQIDGRGLNPDALGPILGNTANLVAFRVGVEDSVAVEPAATGCYRAGRHAARTTEPRRRAQPMRVMPPGAENAAPAVVHARAAFSHARRG